ncbi:hypothetical protein PV08_09821 [Exophiala spinifera]|uniref:Uncharacterized protein n=1 Tax=Exophiala spinifera TaxID=91928 RepID=A0A0D2BN54_9EURO|nr:uncharacterized protein PV08_09821 [Exophiala spinifera]KIW12544.1 hypothetical protein PV08_09821 [Exophiala spinifera]
MHKGRTCMRRIHLESRAAWSWRGIQIWQLLSTDPDLDWSERRSLAFFQDRTALELSGSFQNDFWLSTILPFAQRDAAVRHALVALSSMHEHYAGIDHYVPPSGLDFALDHYGKAIRELVRLNNQKYWEDGFDCALVACALFSSFESLQGHYHTACTHAISGMKMLAEHQRQNHDLSSPESAPVANCRGELMRFFSTMKFQMLEIGDTNFGGARPPMVWGPPSMPERFASYEEALLHMEGLLAELGDYAFRLDELAQTGPVSEEMANRFKLEFMPIKDHAMRWMAVFDALGTEQRQISRSSTTAESNSSSERGSSIRGDTWTLPPAASLLSAFRSLLTGFVQRLEVNDETIMDEYAPDLERCLELCEAFIKQTSHLVTPVPSPTPSPGKLASQSPKVARPSYSLTLGVVPALFLIATSGSNMSTRARAIRLLRCCHRREGFWDSGIAAELAERVCQIQAVVNQKYGQSMPIGCKVLDVSFLPDRNCMVRYRLRKLRPQGDEDHIQGEYETLDENKIYYESLEWDGLRTWKN